MIVEPIGFAAESLDVPSRSSMTKEAFDATPFGSSVQKILDLIAALSVRSNSIQIVPFFYMPRFRCLAVVLPGL